VTKIISKTGNLGYILSAEDVTTTFSAQGEKVNNRLFTRIWGETATLIDHSRKARWVDLVIVVGLAGLVYGLTNLARQWTQVAHEVVEIDLSPWALPRYTFYSLSRGLLAYVLSLLFTLLYGYWAAKDQVAERVLIPLLDILQSIPVLTFMPGLVMGMAALFPSTNVGLELAAVVMIFTGQAWNMTFSFYHSLRSVPQDQNEAATVYRFNWWGRLKWVELPFSTMGLVWNSMMSMAGGWFFLMINEAFTLKDKDFRLPGIGSYMSEAVKAQRVDAMFWAIGAMILMIVGLDQLLWRPVVAWAQKFRVEEGGSKEEASSWFLDWLRRSHILAVVGTFLQTVLSRKVETRLPEAEVKMDSRMANPWAERFSMAIFVLLIALLLYGAWCLVDLLGDVSWGEWEGLLPKAFLTLGRVLLAIGIGTLVALPAGLAIGLTPRLSRLLQPVVQVLASFPAPMLFPLVIAGLQVVGVGLGWGSIVLMLMGTQWYILFNVIAGAMAIPADLGEAARSYRISGWQRFRILYFPAVFPFLVTGWVTAAGGAWNASIVSEYPTFGQSTIAAADGLGAQISEAFDKNNYPLLAASVLVMSTLVVVFNRTVWRWAYRLAEERYALNK
jgi:NitT/TauT family transport system permease protein